MSDADRRTQLRERLSDFFSGVVTRLSPNRSARSSVVRGIVIHTTEGGYESAVNWFLTTRSSTSAHYVISDVESPGGWNSVTAMVPEEEKAWTARSANSVTVNYELAGYARRTREEWLGKYRQQLETAAALVADDVLQYDIPIERSFPGILGHGDLDRFGFPNDHTDPGNGFPWDEFLGMVAKYTKLGDRPTTAVVRTRRGSCLPTTWSRVPKWTWELAEWHLSGRKGSRPKSAPRVVPKAYWLWFNCRFIGRRGV